MLLRYAVKRLILTLPLLLGISILTFGILHLAPGSPVQAETAMNPNISPDAVRQMRRLYGLDQPLPEQYLHWLERLACLDFGRSFTDGQKVLVKVGKALPATLLLNLMSLTLVLALGLPLGIFSAARKGSRAERGLTLASFVAYSFPGFWLALLLQLLLGVKLGILPVAGFRSFFLGRVGWWRAAMDVGWHLVMPLIVTSFGAWAVISRYMRNSMLEVLRQDYIRTARAKGLSRRAVLWRHALPNAMLPIITILGLSLPGLIGGSVIIESIFAWPGMGLLGWQAATSYDYPVVMGVAVIAAVLTVLGNLAADLAYAYFDPRIRY